MAISISAFQAAGNSMVRYAEGMDRVQGVSRNQAGWLTKLIYRMLERRIGLVPRSTTLKAHDTQLMLASVWLDAQVANAKTIPPTLKELVQLKVAAMVGCPF
jgi:hypothetical protein